MKFQGDISSIPITDVVQNLSANRKTGVLSIRRERETRKIVFADGKIVSYGDDAGFSIQNWFRDKNLIDEEIFKKAQRRHRRAKKKTFGEIVSQLEGMDHEKYLAHVKTIVQEMLYETLSFRDGVFEFDETVINLYEFDREAAGAGLRISVNSVMMEAARRIDDWEAIRRSLPSKNDIYQITDADLERLREELDDPVALATAQLLDGTRSIHEVITATPTERFVASSIVADLVSRKLARPVEGDELVKQLDEVDASSGQSARAIARLKAALEREPGNRALLEKTAELSLAAGQKEEATTHLKLLAQALFEDGDLEKARAELRKSLELNPGDIGTWQKLYDFAEKDSDEKGLLTVGLDMVEHLRGFGLNELARDQLLRMLKRFPGDENLRVEHADTLFALGERAEAVKRLLDLARELVQAGKSGSAEKVLARVIEFDPKHQRAREIYEKVRTGKFEKERQRRRILLRAAIVTVFVTAVGLFVGYDLFARKEFSAVTREVLAQELDSREDYQRAKRKLEAVRDRHVFSLLKFFETDDIIRILEEKIRGRESATGDGSRSAVAVDPDYEPGQD